MIWFDYVLCLVPGAALTIGVQVRNARAYASGSRSASGSGISGAEAARRLMSAGGVTDITIEPAAGELSNHYDPSRKVLRLSRRVCEGRSLTDLGIAAHEAGHAIQHASGYPGLIVRNLIVPTAELGSQIFWMLIAAGILLGMLRLIIVAIAMFSVLVVLQLVDLPVELDASRRGRASLRSAGLIGAEEEPIVERVINASAWNYVAAVLTGTLASRYDLTRFGRRRSRGFQE